MQIIQQSHEIIDRKKFTPAKMIEVCGRTCYKSEDKITETSAEKFVRMIAKRGHWSVLEHGTLALEVPYQTFVAIKMCDHEFIKFLCISKERIGRYRYIVSGNIRAWLEFIFNVEATNEFCLCEADLKAIKRWLYNYCGVIYEVAFDSLPRENQTNPNVTPVYELEMTDKEKYLHTFATVRFVTNRGVTHELVRHRPASYSQESTRYVNYGGDDINFILPVWMHEEFLGKWTKASIEKSMIIPADPEWWFINGCLDTEVNYKALLKVNWRPEQAREKLSNDLKTEIVVTANLKEWRHILNLRTSKAAHPQIRDLMKPLEKEIFG